MSVSLLGLAACLRQLPSGLWEGPPVVAPPAETGSSGETGDTGGTEEGVDPLPIEAVAIGAWIGEGPDGRFGALVAPLGDIDGDGSDDLAVGAPGADSDRPGWVYVVSLGDLSVRPPGLQDIDQARAKISMSPGGPENIRDGQYVVDVRRPNEDLLALAIGNTQYNEDQGALYLVHPDPVEGKVPPGEYDASAPPGGVTTWYGELGSAFGHSILTGDFGGTGETQLAVSAPSFANPNVAGSVYLLPTVIDGLEHQVEDGIRIAGANNGDHAGRGLDVGDFCPDGAPSLLIGAPSRSTAWVLCPPVTADIALGSDANLTIKGTGIDRFAHGAHAVSDLDGDGSSDLVLVALEDWYLYTDLDLGGGPAELDDQDATAVIGPRVEKTDQTCDDVQEGDFDGDGTLDLAVGDCTVEAHQGGAIYLFYEAGALAGTVGLDTADTVISGVWEKTGGELGCYSCEDGNGWLAASALGMDFGGSIDIGAVFLLATNGPLR